MDRAEWLEARRSGIGGSDAAAACGLSPYVTQGELYLDKTGEGPLDPPDSERMRMGQLMESVIADAYAEKYGVKLRRSNVIKRHDRYPFMLANVDRTIEGQRVGFEAKNVDGLVHKFGDWGAEDTDEVPQAYLLQCAHYMTVLNYDQWILGALVGGNHLVRYVINRDRELEGILIENETSFWSHVERREPPPIDYDRPDAVRLLRKLYPGTGGGVIDLPDEAMHWHRVRVDAGLEAKAYEATQDGASAHLLHLMGDAAIGRLPDGTEYRRKVVERKGYTVEPCQYVDFRHGKAKEPK
ncbi:YqaJ viral recombinase family nuclease [Paraburkholderia dipogonis]|uniref:YqaJ viral recombinase family nuclease n=1 Tax=Paraburkholderia dipogonis TaxID=1211383 RepID=UPI0038B7198E